jgi:F-type H+-transporting ATPase subunit b
MEMLKIDPWNALFIVINLLVLCVLMRIFLFKPLMGVLEKRDKLIKDDLSNAAEAKKKAAAILKEHEDSMASVKEESAALLSQAKERAGNEYDRIVGSAKEEADRIIEHANEAAQQSYNKAVAGAEGHITELAIDAAQKLLQKNSNEELNSTLYDSFIEETGEGDDSK